MDDNGNEINPKTRRLEDIDESSDDEDDKENEDEDDEEDSDTQKGSQDD